MKMFHDGGVIKNPGGVVPAILNRGDDVLFSVPVISLLQYRKPVHPDFVQMVDDIDRYEQTRATTALEKFERVIYVTNPNSEGSLYERYAKAIVQEIRRVFPFSVRVRHERP